MLVISRVYSNVITMEDLIEGIVYLNKKLEETNKKVAELESKLKDVDADVNELDKDVRPVEEKEGE